MFVVRFAPSPSGHLHIGSIRTVLYNWLFARQKEGKFILRIEDTDENEINPKAEENIKSTLTWLGLGWDEFYKQSERYKQGIYIPYIKRLLSLGWAYPCFCSQEQLRQERVEMLENREPPKYKGTCRSLSPCERQKKIDENNSYILRFKVPNEGSTSFEDFLPRKGKFEFPNKNIGDFVITRPRSEGEQVPTFLLASTIDDYEMGITHVIRGDEHITNTPRQIMIQNSLGFNVPIYAHLPIVLGTDGSKLSKRTGALSILEYRRQGYLPEAILNYVLLLGWAPEDRSEILTIAKMLKQFSLEGVSTSKGSFNKKQLTSINSKHIENLQDEELARKIQEYLKINKLRFDQTSNFDYTKIASICKSRTRVLSDLDFLFQTNLTYQQEIVGNLKSLSSNILETLLYFINDLSDFSSSKIEEAIWQAKKEFDISRADMGLLIRLAITGSKVSPDLFAIMSLLGKENVIKRINSFLLIQEQKT